MNKICSIDGCNNLHHGNGYCGKHYQLVRRYGKLDKTKYGSGTINHDGYRRIFKNGKQIFEHVYIAENVLGRSLLNGECVHHIDENRINNDKTNLVICPNQSYHSLLHRRLRALKVCGNPDYRLCTFCHKYDDPKNLYIKGKTNYHYSCRNLYQRQRYAIIESEEA